MAEEFQESDVIFSDQQDHHHLHHHHHHHVTRVVSRVNQKSKNNKKKKMIKKISNSVPVNIPDKTIFQFTDRDDIFEEEEYYDEGEIIPPHLIVGRRITGQMAFSVCTGNGRTLKGRDLSQVRNSVLKMTGFLET